MDIDERDRTISTFTSKENANGKIINLLLASSVGAEGLDLKNIRHVHIMEPYWNFLRIKQIKARAIRYLSHIDLEMDQRDVQTYIYMAVNSEEFDVNKLYRETIEEETKPAAKSKSK